VGSPTPEEPGGTTTLSLNPGFPTFFCVVRVSPQRFSLIRVSGSPMISCRLVFPVFCEDGDFVLPGILPRCHSLTVLFVFSIGTQPLLRTFWRGSDKVVAFGMVTVGIISFLCFLYRPTFVPYWPPTFPPDWCFTLAPYGSVQVRGSWVSKFFTSEKPALFSPLLAVHDLSVFE